MIEIAPDLENAWQFIASGSDCRLEQQLDAYGVARFLGIRGGALRFELIGHRDLFARGPVDIFQRAPAWRSNHPASAALGQALHVAGGGIAAGDPLATRILLSLFEGYEIAVRRTAWFASDRQVGVRLSSVGIRDNYAAFTRCFQGPLLRSWADVERTRIGFPAAGVELDADARAQLDELAAYLRRDNSITEVFIDGHTDERGSDRVNLQLSQARADVVAGYLTDAGVAPERLVVRYHGSRYPVAANDSAAGRAENRRTTIRLERDWSRLARVDHD